MCDWHNDESICTLWIWRDKRIWSVVWFSVFLRKTSTFPLLFLIFTNHIFLTSSVKSCLLLEVSVLWVVLVSCPCFFQQCSEYSDIPLCQVEVSMDSVRMLWNGAERLWHEPNLVRVTLQTIRHRLGQERTRQWYQSGVDVSEISFVWTQESSAQIQGFPDTSSDVLFVDVVSEVKRWADSSNVCTPVPVYSRTMEDGSCVCCGKIFQGMITCPGGQALLYDKTTDSPKRVWKQSWKFCFGRLCNLPCFEPRKSGEEHFGSFFLSKSWIHLHAHTHTHTHTHTHAHREFSGKVCTHTHTRTQRIFRQGQWLTLSQSVISTFIYQSFCCETSFSKGRRWIPLTVNLLNSLLSLGPRIQLREKVPSEVFFACLLLHWVTTEGKCWSRFARLVVLLQGAWRTSSTYISQKRKTCFVGGRFFPGTPMNIWYKMLFTLEVSAFVFSNHFMLAAYSTWCCTDEFKFQSMSYSSPRFEKALSPQALERWPFGSFFPYLRIPSL